MTVPRIMWLISFNPYNHPGICGHVLHGESSTDHWQASPRTPTQRTFQPQEAVQPQRNQTILQADTPAQKANYPYKRSHPTPLEADAHTSKADAHTSKECTEKLAAASDVDDDAMAALYPVSSSQHTLPLVVLPYTKVYGTFKFCSRFGMVLSLVTPCCSTHAARSEAGRGPRMLAWSRTARTRHSHLQYILSDMLSYATLFSGPCFAKRMRWFSFPCDVQCHHE